MAETLMFTTTINASVTPSITLTPVTNALQLTNASLGFSWMRVDMHEVIVGVGMPTVPAPQVGAKSVPYSVSSARSAAVRSRTPLLIDASVPAGTTSSSGPGIALEAVNNQIVRFETLRQSVIVAP
jgi:hypothetical protein